MEALFPWWLRQRKRMWRIILAHTNLYLEMTHSTSRSDNRIDCVWWLILCINFIRPQFPDMCWTLSWMFLLAYFWMRFKLITFKLMGFEQSRLPSIMWVGFILLVEGLSETQDWSPPSRRKFYQQMVCSITSSLVSNPPTLKILKLPDSIITWANSLK